MMRHGEHGFTLIELLVSMALSLVLMGAAIGLLTVFLNDTAYDRNRDGAQDDARLMVDRITRDLRSAAAVNTGSYGLLERANPYDIEFEAVNPSTTYGGSNTYNQYRIRYCLDSNDTIWRQTETWTTASPPAVPNSTACPDPSNTWSEKTNGQPCCVELTDVTNEIGGDTTRPLFTYGPPGYSGLQQIQEVQVNVVTDLNPGHLPGPSPQLTSGIFLRNENSPPSASFTATKTSNGTSTWDVTLNGSGSTDPNGQTLTYQWYANSGSTGCTSTTAGPSSGLLSTATTEISDGGTYSNGTTETFALVVTDTQGLTNCTSQTLSFP
jgi:prepilin-type N-terminal cleavage/methylation domain-containing protein